MIDPQKFSKSKPVLKPADIAPARVAVLVVGHAEEIELGGDAKVVMTFEEFPDKNYFPNLTSIRSLVDALGPDEKKWLGKRAVLEVVKTNDPVKKRQVEALWIAQAETWPDHMAQADRIARANAESESVANPPTPPVTKNAAQKQTGKRR